ncbi:MAG: AraC family transcriptional regulator [Deferribacterales bacterium]
MSNNFWRSEKLPHMEIRRTDMSNVPYKSHSHVEYLSIGAVDGGETVMNCCGEDSVVSAGMLVFFNPNDPHSCNPINKKSRSYWMMHLDVKWCEDMQREMFGSDSFVPLVSGCVTDEELFGDFCNYCRAVMDEEEYYDGEYELIRIVTRIFEKYCTEKPLDEIPSVILKEVAEYIEENPFENITLEELADKFRQNRFHLLRCFRNTYGLPPHAYQMNIRIERAKDMLKSGKSIADTAADTGFTDQSHFHRIFKKITAATPGEYRQ